MYLPDTLYDLLVLSLYDQVDFPKFNVLKFDFDEDLFAKNKEIKSLCFTKNQKEQVNFCQTAGMEIYKKINFEKQIKILSYAVNKAIVNLVNNRGVDFDFYVVDMLRNKFAQFNTIYGAYDLLTLLAECSDDFYYDIISLVFYMKNVDDSNLSALNSSAKFKTLTGKFGNFIAFFKKLKADKNFEPTLEKFLDTIIARVLCQNCWLK